MSFNKLLKTLADRYASQAVPTKTVQGWETTSDLRRKLIATHINALPVRFQSAKEELKDFVQKTRTLDFTYLDAFRFGIRSLEVRVKINQNIGFLPPDLSWRRGTG